MGIVNRRNAVAGWAAWKLAKRVLRRKAQHAAAPVTTAARRPKALFALLVAAGAGIATFLRSRAGGGGDEK
jgi:hypothetical protein